MSVVLELMAAGSTPIEHRDRYVKVREGGGVPHASCLVRHQQTNLTIFISVLQVKTLDTDG